ncbi:uncharacterized protein EI90DRAFT_3128730 [Cantharellus anzutake]|uniref:uncharacterized protein n=1 Tax=Cantharellus anzutake TaxID=1750568 RepID=UPI0019053213|nr:uncharacterized protein EI90DRAFT_3128730 [Cantharellus anzutake]KAF8325386.1 hypothetical protein EI90DRAFT_3128730 [Cantharellus anzutake]
MESPTRIQQIADGLSGVAWETGVASGLDEPVNPCLPISDYCTGTLCAVMAVLGLVRRAEPGKFGVKGNSFFSPISLTALDAWLRRQGQYPVSYVREKHALHGFRCDTGFGPMLFKTLQVKLTQDPLYNRPGFYNVIEHALFEGRARVTGQPRREEGGKGVKYICLGPVIKFDGIDTSYISTAPWGYFRPGWSEEDADALEEALQEIP